MLTKDWIDPRLVDWTDPYSPLANPGYRKNNNPYTYAALQDQFMQALRNGKGVEPRAYSCPEPADQLIAAGTTYDYNVPIEPNCWIWAVSASGTGQDFLFQVTDSVTGATFFSQPVPMSLMSTARNGTAGRGPQSFLSTPHLFLPPSYPVVRIINTTNFDNICRVTLYGAVEYDV
jgi:hypothetical protein